MSNNLFGDTQDLVAIAVENQEYLVPKELELLRCFQFLNFNIAYEHFCWNASCENCAAEVAPLQGPYERTLSCQKLSEAGLSVKKLPAGVEKK